MYIQERWPAASNESDTFENRNPQSTWCLIHEGKAYPYGDNPFEIQEFVERVLREGFGDYWFDRTMTRRAPPGFDRH